MLSRTYTAVALGGGIGSVLRYLISSIIPTVNGFPYGTIAVNLTGCFLLSYLSQLFSKHWKIDMITQKAIMTGLIGSFTTFSAFTTELVQLMEDDVMIGSFYILVTFIGGLGMTFMGAKVGGSK
ncbi:CrcB family protein [Halobacillus locisalis]|uniref:Fluoride-specific ion channel FluC n=1 Tax=Halobacillus locisalis TaxID=220753 RepID=A0A838CUY2_9BACI|nr:CrcB family protein [Halobacillus locisalis]MBA2175718.1 CrcB family protein [Halobacillus locisalis]